MINNIKNKNIVLGVCGGIAAYKSVELVRLLQKQGARVTVAMSKNAREFVGHLTFEALTGHPVLTDLFKKGDDAYIRHVEWAEQANAVVIAPATANIIGKLTNGIADDALSTFMLAVTAPVILCPSMNTHMYQSKPVQRNLDVLKADGYCIVQPDSGQLACGVTGPGRLPEPEYILDRLMSYLMPKDFKGRKVLVTAGPTQEALDPVRFITNHSSGKMGYAVARAAENRGGEVTMISGPTNLPDPVNVRVIRVRSAREMALAVFDHMDDADIILKVAAVADYRPRDQSEQKIKKEKGELVLSLQKNPDILKEIGKRKKDQVIVGFAAETESLEKNAVKKLTEKNLDIIAGNLVNNPSSGFGTDTNKVNLFYKGGKKEELPALTKDEVAHILLDRILERVLSEAD